MRSMHRIGRHVDVDQLRAFVAVARAGRFTRAARRLGTTQPNLSRRVQQLEAQVGSKLVVRTPARVVLTSAGERFLAHAERALASIDAGRTAIDELSGEPRGVVALGSQPTISAYVLPPLLARFQRRAPQVVLRLREGLAEQIEERVASGELDLALMNLPVRRVDLAAQKLWQEDYMLAVAPSHRLANAERVPLSEAAREPLVVVAGAAATMALLAACEEAGATPNVVVDADNLEAVRRMVEQGLGVALLPRTMAIAAQGPRLRALEVTRGGVRRQVALVHRGEAYLTAAARALRSAIVESLASGRAKPR
jgi:LysR family transcriptional regulator, transcription activator of glutamate synthase operon